MKKISVDDFINILAKKKGYIESEQGKVIAQSCATIQRNAMELMRDTEIDYSRTYKKGHHPSKEGNPPAIDTGNLRRSITYEVDETKGVGLVGSTQRDAPYGVYLEYGTSRGLMPRPWMQPAIKKSLETIGKLFTDLVRGKK